MSEERTVRLAAAEALEIPAASGYRHAGYAASLSEFGAPHRLPLCQGWVLRRRIPGFDSWDAMGCYPLFACRDWSRLPLDLVEMETGLVSLTVVTDPFGEYDEAHLRRCFGDLVAPFKEHFIVDLGRSPDSFIQSHHRRNARKAFEYLRVERCEDALLFLDEWCDFYSNLMVRHKIRGLAAFSRAAFARQLGVPGIVAFRATREGRSVGMNLWYVQGDAAYYHLGAYSDDGYRFHASFALFRRALEDFADAGLHHLDLGAGAGAAGDGADGLSRFKRGWATGTRTAYLCGRIFDRPLYASLTQARGNADTVYFPAYRAGEFA
ncbi:MAG: GNAT family N-acetyltransferase [Thermoanaerobaculia bacterium]|nr:GNAT family N-acetyltransferase [Thermoanaerobaculia bacterium]